MPTSFNRYPSCFWISTFFDCLFWFLITHERANFPKLHKDICSETPIGLNCPAEQMRVLSNKFTLESNHVSHLLLYPSVTWEFSLKQWQKHHNWWFFFSLKKSYIIPVLFPVYFLNLFQIIKEHLLLTPCLSACIWT